MRYFGDARCDDLVFHFQTLLDDFERTVIDDSRLAKRPAEIFVGKMFKMEVWESLLTSMRVGEVAEFWCDAVKCKRAINITTYPAILVLQVLRVGDPMSYQRESWMMEKDEKMQTVPLLHMQGNALVHMKRYEDAASKYKEAVLLLKVVQSREMPGDIDYINLGRMIVPLELNYCQCMLELERYYEVIEHASELLDKHKGLGGDLNAAVRPGPARWASAGSNRELRQLSDRMKEKYWEEREQYWQKLGKTPTTLGDQEEEEEEEEEEENEKERGIEGSAEVVDEEGMGGGKTRRVRERERAATFEEAAGRGGGGGGGGTETRPSESPADREAMDWQTDAPDGHVPAGRGELHMKESRYEDSRPGKYTRQSNVDRKGEDWESLEKVRLPLTLNLSGCLLELQQYQQVVELNTKLLKKHKGNCKAVYQRARAHAALCHEDQARQDFLKLQRLDPKLQPVVRRELKKLGENLRCLHAQQKKTYWETSREKWTRDGSSRARRRSRRR
ncbi:hypothetical protein CRUP_006952 [Coryphaenoides rupestris]|nr:hypothetical protein CRUP_006952 [Coryphaenoides rupestris]